MDAPPFVDHPHLSAARVSRVLSLGAHDPSDRDSPASLMHRVLLAKAATVRESGSNVGPALGLRPHLIDKLASRQLRDLNPTHAICIDAKTSSSVGMGHREQSIYEKLDPLCRFGWQDTLDALGEDLTGEGEAFLEVVWDDNRSLVLGLNHLDGTAVNVVVETEEDTEQFHYQVTGASGVADTVAMATWGDMLNLRVRYGTGGDLQRVNRPRDGTIAALGGQIVNSEVIHFRRSTPRDSYSGYPDWVAAIPFVELVQAMVRHEFDFHFNRGVPEILFTLIGGSLNEKDWEAIEGIFRSHQGISNSRKTAAIHIPGTPETVKVEIHPLAEEGTRDHFGDNSDSMSMMIATAHGVPPLLANILLPGKIGASNEGPNSMLLFQKRKLGQIQKSVSRSLARTLGSGVQVNSPDGPTGAPSADEFLAARFDSAAGMDPDSGTPIYHERGNGFHTVLDGMTLGAQDTMSRMREPVAGSGRDPNDGLLGGTDDRQPGDPRRTR